VFCGIASQFDVSRKQDTIHKFMRWRASFVHNDRSLKNVTIILYLTCGFLSKNNSLKLATE